MFMANYYAKEVLKEVRLLWWLRPSWATDAEAWHRATREVQNLDVY